MFYRIRRNKNSDRLASAASSPALTKTWDSYLDQAAASPVSKEPPRPPEAALIHERNDIAKVTIQQLDGRPALPELDGRPRHEMLAQYKWYSESIQPDKELDLEPGADLDRDED